MSLPMVQRVGLHLVLTFFLLVTEISCFFIPHVEEQTSRSLRYIFTTPQRDGGDAHSFQHSTETSQIERNKKRSEILNRKEKQFLPTAAHRSGATHSFENKVENSGIEKIWNKQTNGVASLQKQAHAIPENHLEQLDPANQDQLFDQQKQETVGWQVTNRNQATTIEYLKVQEEPETKSSKHKYTEPKNQNVEKAQRFLKVEIDSSTNSLSDKYLEPTKWNLDFTKRFSGTQEDSTMEYLTDNYLESANQKLDSAKQLKKFQEGSGMDILCKYSEHKKRNHDLDKRSLESQKDSATDISREKSSEMKKQDVGLSRRFLKLEDSVNLDSLNTNEAYLLSKRENSDSADGELFKFLVTGSEPEAKRSKLRAGEHQETKKHDATTKKMHVRMSTWGTPRPEDKGVCLKKGSGSCRACMRISAHCHYSHSEKLCRFSEVIHGNTVYECGTRYFLSDSIGPFMNSLVIIVLVSLGVGGFYIYIVIRRMIRPDLPKEEIQELRSQIEMIRERRGIPLLREREEVESEEVNTSAEYS